VANLAFGSELGERTDRLLEWDVGVHRVQLVEIDALEAQAREARLARGAQVLGASVRPGQAWASTEGRR
jgi:hypothetical protein